MSPVRLSIVGVFCASASAASVQAAELASINLRGYVPQVSSVKLSDVNPLVSNDLRAAVRDVLLARIHEHSNSQSGYSIKLISENGRRHRVASLANEQTGAIVPYTLSYGGQSVRLVNGQAEILRARAPREERGRESELRVSTDGSDRIPTGEYSDILTIVIAAR